MSNIQIDAFCPVGIGGTKGVDTSKLKLFVGGLPADLTSKDLFDIFSSFGTIREAVVIPDRFRVRSRCYGFVTFVSTESVSAAFQAGPLTTHQGNKLTVVLASTNSKPRRARFNVKHGTSGHKQLSPMHKNTDTASAHAQPPKGSNDDCKQSQCARNNSNSAASNSKLNKGGKTSTYTDPSLFRTANIQPIAPAVFDIAVKPKTAPAAATYHMWPNKDIQKDFNQMHKLRISGSSSKAYKAPRSSWKAIVIQKGLAKDCEESTSCSSYSQSQSQLQSHKWTPVTNGSNDSDSQSLPSQGGQGNECPSVANSDTPTNAVTQEEIEDAMMEKLKSEFECRMNRSLQGQLDRSQSPSQSQSPVVFNQNHKGTWSPYQPTYQTAFTLATSIWNDTQSNIDGSSNNPLQMSTTSNVSVNAFDPNANSAVCFSIPMEYNSQY